MYVAQLFYKNEKKNKYFLITLILIILFDVLILGFYFGSEKLLQRFFFLQDQINEYFPSDCYYWLDITSPNCFEELDKILNTPITGKQINAVEKARDIILNKHICITKIAH